MTTGKVTIQRQGLAELDWQARIDSAIDTYNEGERQTVATDERDGEFVIAYVDTSDWS